MSVNEIPNLELAMYIADKLNKMLGRKLIIRDSETIPHPEITATEILCRNPSREELIFYFERMCK